ncbi:MAG: hypothetical protein ACFFDM_13470 [Candidatus Thorarchaeota archaeon]
MTKHERLWRLPRKIVFTLIILGLLTPMAALITDDGVLLVFAALWLFRFQFIELSVHFEWILQSFSYLIMWIWQFVFLYIFLQYYNGRMSLRPVKFSAVIAQSPWVLATLGIFLNLLVGGNIIYLAVPIPFFVLVSFAVFRKWPRYEPPKSWLEEETDASWEVN